MIHELCLFENPLLFFASFFSNSLSLYVCQTFYLSKSSQAQVKKKEPVAVDACSVCKRHDFFSRRDLAKHERSCREIEKKQICQDIFDHVRKPRTPRVKVERAGETERESEDVPSSSQVSPTDDCCIVERNHVNLFFSLNSFLFEAEHHTDL